jgi:flagellin-like protein
MRKGISPIVAVVLLIAIAVIAAVGLYFWVGGLATKQPTTSRPGVITANCQAPNLYVTNTGTTTIWGGTLNVTTSTGTVTMTGAANHCNRSLGSGESCLYSTDAGTGDAGFIFASQVGQAQFSC